jgi:hypothetical protein
VIKHWSTLPTTATTSALRGSRTGSPTNDDRVVQVRVRCLQWPIVLKKSESTRRVNQVKSDRHLRSTTAGLAIQFEQPEPRLCRAI